MTQMPLKRIPRGWICCALLAGCTAAVPPAASPRSIATPQQAPLVGPPGPQYPSPHFVQIEQQEHPVTQMCVDARALSAHTTLDGVARELADQAGLALVDADSPGCSWRLRFLSAPPALSGAADDAWKTAGASPERYLLVPDARAPDLRLFAATEAGGLLALRRVFSLLIQWAGARYARAATIVDFPDITPRGVVEGFYGPQYAPADRLHIMGLMGRVFMNSYVYAPKNDGYCYGQWYAPYPTVDGAPVAAAARYAVTHGMSFRWGISPSWGPPETSIRFSSDEDFARLAAKLESMRALGVEQFAVLLDDVNGGLYWPEDQARFATVAEAHADLLSRVLGLLQQRDPAARLLAVGSDYTSQIDGWEDYNAVLGKNLPDGIDLMWTGPYTYSPALSAADLAPINGLLGRKVVIWDNAPTQLGPLTGRSADLAGSVSGYFFNPVLNEAQQRPVSDFIQVLGPEGDLLWHPGTYDPVSSFADWAQLDGARRSPLLD